MNNHLVKLKKQDTDSKIDILSDFTDLYILCRFLKEYFGLKNDIIVSGKEEDLLIIANHSIVNDSEGTIWKVF